MITDEHFQDLDQLLAKCVEHENIFSAWEQGFVSEWADKLGTYGASVRVSDKQQQIFDRLKEKLYKKGLL